MIGSKVPGVRATVNTVAEGSEFWQDRANHLARLQEQYTGHEAEYLDMVNATLFEQIELARGVLIREIGLDIKTEKQLRPASPEVLRQKSDWLKNVESYGREFIKIAKVLARTMQAAEQNGRDPILEAYKQFFWAIANVPAASTVFLMQDTIGDEKKHTTLLTAGWADAHISLQGQHASRLLPALLAEGEDARKQLRQELPGAVLEAAEEWQSGKELLVSERAKLKSGKKTAGRRQPTFLSRVTRTIEQQADSSVPGRVGKVRDQAPQWQSSATRHGAQGADHELLADNDLLPNNASIAKQWRDLVQSVHLGAHEAEIANYITSNLDCLATTSDGGLRLRRGTQLEISRELKRPHGQVRQETMRLLKKLNAALILLKQS